MVVNRKSYLNCLHFDYWHGIYCHGKRILYSRRNLPESRTTFRSVPHKNSLKPAFFAIRLLKREGWSDRICVNFYGLFAVEPQISVRIWTQQNFDRKTRIFWSIFFYSPQETHQKLIKIQFYQLVHCFLMYAALSFSASWTTNRNSQANPSMSMLLTWHGFKGYTSIIQNSKKFR